MTWGASGRRLGYQAHYVVDGGKARIVLNALVAPSEVTENRPMLDLLRHTCFRWKLRPHHITADGKYGTLENVAALEESGVRAYVALHESGSRPGFFAKGEFRYDPEADVYSCPAGKLLRPLGKEDGEDRSDRETYYRARASECAPCPLKPRCTTNKNGCQLRRHPGERHVDLVRSYRGTAPYEKALRKRKVWVEPLFAEAKDWHGMRRFRLRTLRRVNAEALLVAAGQNIKRLLFFGGRKPRKPAQVAALRPPAACIGSRSSGRHLLGLRGQPKSILQQAASCAYISGLRNRDGFWDSLGEFWDTLKGQAAIVLLTRVFGSLERSNEFFPRREYIAIHKRPLGRQGKIEARRKQEGATQRWW